MAVCTTLTVQAGAALPPAPPGATHVFVLTIQKLPGSTAFSKAVTYIADYLAGKEVLGYKLDLQNLTGWDVLKVEYDEPGSKIYIWMKSTAKGQEQEIAIALPAIPPALIIVLGVIVIILILLLLLVTAVSMYSVAGDVVGIIDNAIRMKCIKGYIDKGKTPDEALKLCPETPATKPTDWGTIAIIGIAVITGAYIVSQYMGRKS